MRNRWVGFGAGLVVALAAFSCGGSSGNTYTCNFAANSGICWEWTTSQSLSSSQQSQLQTACTSNNPPGTYATGANCPSPTRVGTCPVNNTKENSVTYKIKFSPPPWTAAWGKQPCPASIGTWTAG